MCRGRTAVVVFICGFAVSNKIRWNVETEIRPITMKCVRIGNAETERLLGGGGTRFDKFR